MPAGRRSICPRRQTAKANFLKAARPSISPDAGAPVKLGQIYLAALLFLTLVDPADELKQTLGMLKILVMHSYQNRPTKENIVGNVLVVCVPECCANE